MYHDEVSNEDSSHSTGRAIKDVTAAFSRALKQALSEAGTQASQELIDELHDATTEINNAIASAGLVLARRGTPRAERTRTRLLGAARRLIAEKGYEGASVGDIASAAGYTKGAFYANFGSKEQLFTVLAQEMLAEDIEQTQSSEATLPEPGSCLGAGDTESTLIVLELYLYAIRHPEARAELTPLLTAAQEGYAALIHRSRLSGGDDQESGAPTEADRDLAFAYTALNTFGGIIAPLQSGSGGQANVAATIRRLIERLNDAG